MTKAESEKTSVRSSDLRDIFPEDLFAGEVSYMEPMTAHTSLRIGGPADVYAAPRDLPALSIMHGHLRREHIPFFPLGGGTNILVRDGGIEGVVVSFRSLSEIEPVNEESGHVFLSVGPGTPLQRLVSFSKENGYSGLEGMAGIPGTVGGAVCGNAGAFGYEMKDVLVSLKIMDAEGKVEVLNKETFAFGYRNSGLPQDCLLLCAEIRLRKEESRTVSERTEEFLKMKRASQPLREHSAGCVFRNPEGASAGRFIDDAGCKGMRVGDVEVSAVHANFIINRGKATASDFLLLMEKVADRVEERFGVALEPEIKIVGREGVN